MAIYYMIEPWYKKGGGLGPLNDCTWAEIQQAAQDGKAANYWSVGDRKAVVLNGTVGAKTFSNQTVYAYILGFNHNASVEGNNTIHFQLGFDALTGGNHIAFCDSQYRRSGSSSAFRMNTVRNATGGWNNSYMRNTIIPAFISAMPSDLQSVLKTVTKYTDNGTGSTHDSSSDVTATNDKVFLLADYEIFGASTSANQYEQNSQAQYAYYADSSNSKIMYNDTSMATAVNWWGRSPFSPNNMSFCYVDIESISRGNAAYYSYGFAPAFVVG